MAEEKNTRKKATTSSSAKKGTQAKKTTTAKKTATTAKAKTTAAKTKKAKEAVEEKKVVKAEVKEEKIEKKNSVGIDLVLALVGLIILTIIVSFAFNVSENINRAKTLDGYNYKHNTLYKRY